MLKRVDSYVGAYPSRKTGSHFSGICAHAIAVVITFFVVSHAPAHAQAARTWVASNGNDATACSRAAPCRTFAGAIAKTAAGGAITCVDAAEYGAVTIAKSISIVCDHTLAAITTAATGVTITTAATDTVTLSGLDIEGNGAGVNGINFTGGGTLHVHKIRVHGFRGTTTNRALGINFVPTAAAKLFVSDSVITDNGFGFGGAGILVAPASAVAATASIVNCRVENNLLGIRTIGTPTTTSVAIADSTFVGNSSGIANSGSVMMLSRIVSANNTNQGISNGNAGTMTRLSDSLVSGNATGIANGSGAFITSYKNNQIRGNTLDGTPLPSEIAE
jgi:hypothetical protein